MFDVMFSFCSVYVNCICLSISKFEILTEIVKNRKRLINYVRILLANNLSSRTDSIRRTPFVIICFFLTG